MKKTQRYEKRLAAARENCREVMVYMYKAEMKRKRRG